MDNAACGIYIGKLIMENRIRTIYTNMVDRACVSKRSLISLLKSLFRKSWANPGQKRHIMDIWTCNLRHAMYNIVDTGRIDFAKTV